MGENISNCNYLEDVLGLIDNVYHIIFYVNLTTGENNLIKSNRLDSGKKIKELDHFSNWASSCVADGMVYAEDISDFINFLDVERLKKKLYSGRKYFSHVFRRRFYGTYRWEMIEIIPAKAYNDEDQIVILCVRDIDDERQKELDREAKLSEKEKQLMADRVIMIIDDSEIQREALSYFLSPHYKTVESNNGFDALEYLKKNSTEISLILLDLNMPVLNGIQFLSLINQDDILRMIPVLVLTGDNDDQEEINCLKAGAVDFITKPFNAHVLLSRIERAISLHEKTVMLNVLRKDDLTGCYAKDYFIHMAEQLLLRYPDEEFDIVCNHILNLANIKEQYGYKKSEAVLKYVATLEKQFECENSIFGRWSDDTFVRILPHKEEINDKLRSLEKKTSYNYIHINAGLPPFWQKYGIYERVDRNLPISVMYDRAMMAIEKIKQPYGKIVNVYDDSIRLGALKVQRVLENMEDAIEEKQLQVWYQPKHSVVDGSLIGAEALARWIHPKYGFMSPGEFIPIFEENGFVAHVDRYIWEETCAAQRRWRDMGFKPLPISVNISRKDFLFYSDQEIFMPLIRKYGLSPKDLHLEVTESAYVDSAESVIRQVNKLHDSGFVIELDDFGTGYSSLNMFSHMNIDVVKLDMSFIRQKQSHKNDQMMSYIIRMCKAMGLRVLSEGVETDEQRRRLISMGCDYAQGYYFSKPLPEKEFVAYLATNY